MRGEGVGPRKVGGQRGYDRGSRLAMGLVLAWVFILEVIGARRHRPRGHRRGCHGVRVEYQSILVSVLNSALPGGSAHVRNIPATHPHHAAAAGNAPCLKQKIIMFPPSTMIFQYSPLLLSLGAHRRLKTSPTTADAQPNNESDSSL